MRERRFRDFWEVDEGDETLTESEGAINFMVIEMGIGSSQELPSGNVMADRSRVDGVDLGEGEVCGDLCDAARPKRWVAQ